MVRVEDEEPPYLPEESFVRRSVGRQFGQSRGPISNQNRAIAEINTLWRSSVTRRMSKMSEHVCSLPRTNFSGLPKLPPNASIKMRLQHKLRNLMLIDPNSLRSKAFYYHKSAIRTEQKRHVSSPYKYMIHPFSSFYTIVEVIFFVVWLTKMTINPVVQNMVPDMWIIRVVNYVLSGFQTFIIISVFFIGYVDKEGTVILNQGDVAKRYLKSYFFFDLLSTEVFNPAIQTVVTRTVLQPILRVQLKFILQFIDVPCLYVRIYSILNDVAITGELLGIPLRIRKITSYLLKTYLYLHLFCCLMYFVPQVFYHGEWPINSWINQAKITPLHKPSLSRIYGECMLFTVCYFFGASAGKYRVSETSEQICLSFITLFGRLYTLFVLADVLRFFGIVGLSEASYEKQIMQLNEYMMVYEFAPDLRSRTMRYYENKLQRRHFDEKEILNTCFSDRLRAELFMHSARKLMQKSDFFKYLPSSEIATLISMMRVETFAPRDVIFKAGQEVHTVYFISFGSVAILSKGGRELCHLEDGEVFGLCSWVLQKMMFATVAIETTELFIISSEELENFLKDFPKASVYLKQLAVERFAVYMEAEENIINQTDNCLQELRKGSLLEKKRKRKIVGV